MPNSCPNCQLINPPSALRCDCGYDFETGTMQQSYLRQRQMPEPVTAGIASPQEILLKVAMLAALYYFRSDLEGWWWWLLASTAVVIIAIPLMVKVLRARK